MKKIKYLARLALTLAAALMLTATCFASGTVNAARTSARIYLNDDSVSITGYLINGNNYFKLRDLAYAMRDTASCFDVAWNAEAGQVVLFDGGKLVLADRGDAYLRSVVLNRSSGSSFSGRPG